MTSHSELQLLPLSDFAWPISYRWHIQTSWGVYTQTMTVNAPELHEQAEASQRLGGLLYMGSVATATVRSSYPFLQETVLWRVNDFPLVKPLNVQQGLLFGRAAPRNRTGVIVLHTGHADGRARRRWFLGGMPDDWSANGLLTLEGAENMQTLGRQIINGLVAGSGPLPAELLLAYPQAVPIAGPGFPVVGFRRVSHLRVCQYTERTPDLSGSLWPSPD